MLGFPRIVDEVSARMVAAVVAVLALVALLTGAAWLVALLAAGFVLRVLAGPRLSPLALLVTKVVRPRLPLAERPTPGPPKRFAQAVGAALTGGAAVLLLGPASRPGGGSSGGRRRRDARVGARVCLGCQAFAGLMRLGLIPASVCAECADLTLRRPPAVRA